MDPDANLREQREIAATILDEVRAADNALRLAELVRALDEWLCNGGFIPDDWELR